MTRPILYCFSFSPFSQRLHYCCIEKRIDIDLRNAVQDPTYRAEAARHSPLGTLPVFVDGDCAMGDSTAIALYLDRRYPERPLLPADPRAAARAFEVIWLVDCVMLGAGDLGVRFGELSDHSAWPAIRDKKMARIQGSLDRLGELAAEPSLTGEGFGVAEIWLLCSILWFERLPTLLPRMPFLQKIIDLECRIPKGVTQWVDHHRARPELRQVIGLENGR